MLGDVVDIALLVAAAFEGVGAGYFLGGSLASSLQGEPRATNDVDFVTDLAEAQVAAFERALGPDFAVDTSMVREAVRRRGLANFFYLPAYTKIDLHIVGTTAFDRLEFERRRRVSVGASKTMFVKTPEDTVLRKLLWFEQGGRASSKQWRDVVEVLRVSGHVLDDAYLDDWAARVGVTPLLAEARAAAKKPPEPA